MAAAGSIVVSLLALTGSFVTDMKRAEGSLASFGKAAARVDQVITAVKAGVAAAAVAELVRQFNKAVGAIDAFNDLKDATGASIENISALDSVARRTGGSFETVEGALIKFNQVLSKAGPDNSTTEVLKAIGLNATELKRIDPAEALRQTAVALSKFADDGNKARVIQELFGKSVKEAAPFLKDLAEQETLVAKTTTADAEAAEKYNKSLFEFEAAATDFGRNAATAVLPALNEMIARFNDAVKAHGGFRQAIVAAYKESLSGIFTGDLLKPLSQQISETRQKIKELSQESFDLNIGGPTPETEARTQAIREEVAELRKREAILVKAQEREGFPQASYSNEGRMRPPAAAPGLPSAPDVAKLEEARKAREAAAARVEPEFKKRLDGRIKAIQDFGRQQADAYQFANEQLEDAYADGLLSLGQTYDEQKRIREDALKAQLAAIDKEIAAYQSALPHLTSTNRIDVENKIAEAVARRAEAESVAAQKGIRATENHNRELNAQLRAYQDLRAQILEMQGDTAGAAAIRNRGLVATAASTVENAGGDPADVKQYGDALNRQTKLSEAQKEYNRLLDQTRNAEESILLTAQESGMSEVDTLRAVGEHREKALQQLGDMAQKARALADESKNPDAIAFADGLALAYRRASLEVDPLLEKTRELGQQVGQSIADNFGDALIQGKGLREMLKGIGSDLQNLVVKKLITEPLGKEIGNILGGTGKDGGLLGGLFGSGSKAGDASKSFGVLMSDQNGPNGPSAAGATQSDGGFLSSLGSLFGIGGGGGSSGLSGLSTAASSAVIAINSLSSAASSAAIALQAVGTSSASSSGAGLLGKLFSGSASSAGSGGSGAAGGADVFFTVDGAAHDGGIIGKDRLARRTPGAPLASNERRVVLEVGEEVLTRDDPRHRRNMMGAPKYHTGGIIGSLADRMFGRSGPKMNQIATTRDAAAMRPIQVYQSFAAGTSKATTDQAAASAGAAVRRATGRIR